MNKISVDTAINARWIVPVVPRQRVLENCALLIREGRILDIVPQSGIGEKYAIGETFNLPHHALIPGLINCHGHAAMSLLRGYADDKPLKVWLEQHIWPTEARWVSEEFVSVGSELAIAEMLLSGTTCFSDMYFFPEVCARAAQKSGIRAQLVFPILDFPTAWASGPDEYLDKGLKLHDQYRDSDLIRIGFGPHAPYTVSDGPLQRVATLSEELQAPVQIHLHETAQEVQDALKNSGRRPSQRLFELGLMSPLTQCVHVTQVDSQDVDIFENSGAHLIHCPDSNMKLASGTCPVNRFLQAGINVALGTDGAASNNDLDMFSEMQHAALLAKLDSGDASALDSATALEMATINGAKALGIDDCTGSLEKGKYADICAVDMSQLRFQPLYQLVSQLVYTNVGDALRYVWVAGRLLVKDRELQTLSSDNIAEAARVWQEKIQGE